METLQLLGVALGLATLAGINLYLTVFVSGLAIQQGWIILYPQYAQLDILANPIIITVSGVLFALEFFADKIPWVDSLWDAVHTFIRPIGGAFLAISVLGDSHPVYDVLVGLLAGGMALTTHGAKAGTRLLVNASPEPFSNIAVSLAEDATVLGGLALIYKFPIAALIVALAAVTLVLWFAPRIFRIGRTMLWFGWRRALHATGAAQADVEPPQLPPDLEIALVRARGEDVAVLWAAPCVAGGGHSLRRHTFGWLLLTGGERGGLDFAQNVEDKPRLESLAIDGWKAMHRTGLVCDRVVIYETLEGKKQTFQFDRSRREVAEVLVRMLNQRSLPKREPSTAAAE
ncbi:MAG: DUF4126 domain-containing protein [Chthoniobacterales bacterium]